MPKQKPALKRANMIQVKMPVEDYEKLKPYAVKNGLSTRNKLIRKLFKQALIIK